MVENGTIANVESPAVASKPLINPNFQGDLHAIYDADAHVNEVGQLDQTLEYRVQGSANIPRGANTSSIMASPPASRTVA